jgi:hypothetical protein
MSFLTKRDLEGMIGDFAVLPYQLVKPLAGRWRTAATSMLWQLRASTSGR